MWLSDQPHKALLVTRLYHSTYEGSSNTIWRHLACVGWPVVPEELAVKPCPAKRYNSGTNTTDPDVFRHGSRVSEETAEPVWVV